MSFSILDGGFWSQIRTQFVKKTRTRRHTRIGSMSALSAQVEFLESRQMLSVTYQGGDLLTHVETQAVYLGSNWTNTPALQAQKLQLEQFNSSIVNGPYMDMLANAGYDVGRGTSSAGVVANVALSTTTPITDKQIQTQVQAMITSGQLQAPDANRLYMIYVQPGVLIQFGSNASNTTFLGYHSAFAGKTAAGAAIDIHYAVISYPGTPNFTSSSQGFSSDLNDLTTVASHELADAVTDPNVNYAAAGWSDSQSRKELAELAAGSYAVLNGYEVSNVVNLNGAIITPSTVQTPPASGLVSPVVTAAASSSTSGQLTWKSVTSVEGYQVFQVVGSKLQLLTTLTPGSLSYTINGLSPGSTTSFEVAAYRGTASVNSATVSIATPAAASLPAPTVTAMALNSTMAFLSWNAVSGATAYRVYYITGTGSPQLLGTLNSSSAIGGKFYLSVSGLARGSNVKFMIEAFNTTQKGDSLWVGLNMPQS